MASVEQKRGIMKVHPPTPEQQAALDATNAGKHAVLQAVAGAGKSSTLNMIANQHKGKKILYVAYNKSIQLDAQANFPKHVICKTSHAIAWSPSYGKKLNKVGKQTAAEASKLLGVPRLVGWKKTFKNDLGHDIEIPARTIMRWALETVKRFCYTADTEVQNYHVPTQDGFHEAKDAIRKVVFPLAQLAWEDLNSDAGVLKFSPDHMLKQFALTNPRLGYDIILLDEAQDLNDVVTDLITKQTNRSQVIVVGDSSQQLYEWRGANDALVKFSEAFPEAANLALSQSFRFGPAVAEEANKWLSLIDAPVLVKGFDKIDSKVQPVLDPDAILCRTNAGVVEAVMEGLEAGMKVALVGGGEAIKHLAWAAQDLMNGKTPDSPEFGCFKDWNELVEYAKEEDQSLQTLVRMVELHGPDALINAAKSLVSEEDADLIVSTIHKSKGREWRRVRIGNDCQAPKPNTDGEIVISKAMARMYYVAVTRATHELDCEVLSWIDDVKGVH